MPNQTPQELRLPGKVIRWRDYEQVVAEIMAEHAAEVDTRIGSPLFRGHSNWEWKLRTTFERAAAPSEVSLFDYQRLALIMFEKLQCVLPDIQDAPQILDLVELQNACRINYSYDIDFLPNANLLSLLRHHNFPSPLLDWSTEHKVAATFAFRNASRLSKYVAVKVAHVPRTRQGNLGVGIHHVSCDPKHPRHRQQSSKYTICTSTRSSDLMLAKHEEHFLTERGRTILIDSRDRDEAMADLADIEEGLMPGQIEGFDQMSKAAIDSWADSI